MAKVSYRNICPKKRYKDLVIDRYYDLTAGDFLSDEECRSVELQRIANHIRSGKGLTDLPCFDPTELMVALG